MFKTALQGSKKTDEEAVGKLWECIYCLCTESRDNALVLVDAFTELADSITNYLSSGRPENITSLVIECLVVVSQQLSESQRDASTSPLIQLLITSTLNSTTDSAVQKQTLQGLVKLVSTSILSQLVTGHDKCSDLIRLIGHSDVNLRSVTTALLIRLLELSTDKGRVEFTSFLKLLVGKWISSGKATDKTSGFRLLAALFHAHPSTGAEIVQKFASDFQSVIESIDMEKEDVQLSIVEALSAGSIDKSCRALFTVHCLPYLESLSIRAQDSELKRVGTVVLSKLLAADESGPSRTGLGGGVTTDALMDSCIASILMDQRDPRTHLSTIEALVMLTTSTHSPRLKNKLCSLPSVLERLVSLGLKSQGESTLEFGVCCVFLNLASYPKRLSAEEEQVKKLRRMAKDASVPDEDEEKAESDAEVEKRNVALIRAGLVPLLVKLSSSSPSQNMADTLSKLFLTLATTPSNRGVMVQQGSLKALKSLIHRSVSLGLESNTSSHALAKILISVDPSLAFKGPADAIECVLPLLRLCKGMRPGLTTCNAY
jgi:hypothetical protein